LRDICITDQSWAVVALRYFNPIGAHPSALIGEDPVGIPNNLLPLVMQVAAGQRERVLVYGNDYDTYDGTCVRDYIHVVDLALGHVAALNKLKQEPGELVLNLGTGRPYSVLEVHAAFEKAVGKPIPYTIEPRRDGDIAIYFADPTKAKQLLGWTATLDINAMAEEAWRWQQQNPNGFE